MRVKICGIARPEDARVAEEAGADAIGLIFAERSKRRVTPARAAEIRAEVGPLVSVVGVFVDAPLDFVTGLARELRLGAVQLHGSEGSAYVDAVRRVAPVIRATGFRPGLGPADLARLRSEGADAVLLDGLRPGSGEAFDWAAAAALAGAPRLILAGGLDPSNVAAGIRALRPYAVDVASGVEAAPGVKDAGKVRAFVEAAKGGG